MSTQPMSRHHQALIWLLIGFLAGGIVLAIATRMAGAAVSII